MINVRPQFFQLDNPLGCLVNRHAMFSRDAVSLLPIADNLWGVKTDLAGKLAL